MYNSSLADFTKMTFCYFTVTRKPKLFPITSYNGALGINTTTSCVVIRPVIHSVVVDGPPAAVESCWLALCAASWCWATSYYDLSVNWWQIFISPRRYGLRDFAFGRQCSLPQQRYGQTIRPTAMVTAPGDYPLEKIRRI